MNKELSPQYNFKQIEDNIYKLWEESGFFNPDNLKNADKETFTIALPPPNVTGTLHMGHALNATIQDILIRKKRMEGYKTLWIPGTDHAGIATQNVVEKQLKKEGLTRHQLGKEKFLERVWEWKEKHGNIILSQLKKIGASCDWSRTAFTMDPNYAKAVKEAFNHYYKKGWIYRGERVVNWCPRCGTSLSDLELEYQEEKGKLWYIKYPLAEKGGEFLIVATTRPETLLGDSAIAVSPKDERYGDLMGKKVILPIKNREIPVISDIAVEKEFGTGAVKVTPAHDFADADMGERHNLPVYKIIDEHGRMTAEAGEEFKGLKTLECREKVIEELKKLGFLEKEEDYMHSVAKCSRCGGTVEPLPSLQWFLKMSELAKLAIKAVESGKIKFHPERWSKVYLDWLSKVKDWCISRQIWWGHQIPIEDSEDVLDTWFSSALWPFAILGWPQKTKELKEFYPTSVLSTARDIINLWVARMVFSGEEFMGKEPFKDIIIHATVLTKDGKRMSKSLGTGIDPMTLIDKYGADATRFGLIWQSMGGQDVHWSEEHVVAGRKLANKLWNATRFVLITTDKITKTYDHHGKNLTEADKQILQYLIGIKNGLNNHINNYNFGLALHDFYDFFWHEFCDIYLETAKKQLENEESKENTKEILSYTLYTSLKLLHPFMPFITEQIFQILPTTKEESLLMIEKW